MVQACDSQSPLDNVSDEIERLGEPDQGDNNDEGNSNGSSDNDDGSFESEMLRAINAARSTGRRCGSQFYEAVPTVGLDERLTEAARVHTQDMVDHNYLGHQDSQGNWPGDRVRSTGYNASITGENVAAGYADIDSVMRGWLESAGHCANIMNGSYEHVGVAMLEGENTQYGRYWTQVFAAPR